MPTTEELQNEITRLTKENEHLRNTDPILKENKSLKNTVARLTTKRNQAIHDSIYYNLR